MSDGLPIFFKDAEETLFLSMGRELVETLTNQHFTLFRINVDKTNANFYGESKKKIYKDPVEVKARIRISDADVYLEGGFRRLGKGDLSAYVYSQHLGELGVEINVGDFIGFQGKFYEVYDPGYNKDSMNKKFAGDRDFMREILAKVTHEEVFKSTEGES